MTDVAKLAGVSQTTVSFVVNNLDAGLPERTKRKVLQACEKLNYTPNEAARRLATRVSHAIGLAIYDISAVVNYRQSGATVLASVYRAAEMRQHKLQIYTTHERSESGVDVGTYYAVPVRSHEVDGVILWDAFVDERQVTSTFTEGLPIVTLDRRCGNVPAVVPDYEHGFRAIAEHLSQKGYHRVAMVTQPGSRYRDTRATAALTASAPEFGITVDGPSPLEVDIETQTDARFMSRLVESILSRKPRPQALVCTYDTIALGLLAALHEAKVSVPDELAVVGCAGVPAAADPAYDLTTLDLRHDLMGQHAVDMVLRMVKGESLAGSCVVVQPELVTRSSA